MNLSKPLALCRPVRANEGMSGDREAARSAMLRQHLQSRGISDARVLEALRRVPREQFVEPGDESLAYADSALGIACGQTISQPYIVALMTQALEVSPGQRVLEIGTGSGYQAAVLAELGAEVFTIERHRLLAEQAQTRLNQLYPHRVHIRVGDGLLGWPEEAPFERVIVTAAGPDIPPAVWQQVAEGGLMVAPLGPIAEQTLEQIRKIAGRPIRQPLTGCRFVPLLPGIARGED